MRNVILMLAMFCLVGCNSTVNPGTVGIAINWGSVQPWTYSEGFHWISPFTDVKPMSIRTETYTMAGPGDEAQVNGSVNVLTKDQLAVSLDVSVQYHLNGQYAVPVYRFFGENYADTIVHPLTRTAIRDAASQFSATDLIDHREQLQNQMEHLVREQLRNTISGRQIHPDAIIIDNILVRNIDLPQSLDNAIAAVQNQKQQTAQREQAMQTAQAESDRLRIEAEGAARALQIHAEAEARANQTISQSLTPTVLRARQIELTGQMLASPTTRVVMLPAGGDNPFIIPVPNQ